MDNALDRSLSFSYDPNDRLTQEQIVNSLVPNSPVASTTLYEYGTLGAGGSLSAGTTLARVTKFQGTNTSATGTKLQQTEYRYDVAGRTAEVKIESFGSSPSVTTTSFTYDHAGTRLSKTESDGLTTKTTLYTVDAANPTGYAQVIEELTTTSGSSGTQVRTSYVIGLDVIAQQSAERTLAAGTWSAWQQQEMLTLLYDGHGSTRALLIGVGSGSPNSSPPIPPAQIATGQLFTYDAYGQMLPRFAGTSEVAINPKTTLLYSGEQTDGSTGLQYLRARYYSPASGRFTQMDPFSGMQTDPQSLHKYLYAHANPVMNADPSGDIIPLLLLSTQFGIGGGLAIGAGIVAMSAIASAAIAATEAYLFSDGDPWQAAQIGASYGAAFGAGGLVAPLFTAALGAFALGYGVGGALREGDFGRAAFRVGTGVGFAAFGSFAMARFGGKITTNTFRVQGGVPPKASRAYIVLDEFHGTPNIETQNVVYVFFNKQQALAYQANCRHGADIVSFKVTNEFVNSVRNTATPQRQAKPGLPQKSDPHYPDGFGLPRNWIERMLANAVSKSDFLIPANGVGALESFNDNE